jgi:hypothetical protein
VDKNHNHLWNNEVFELFEDFSTLSLFCQAKDYFGIDLLA